MNIHIAKADKTQEPFNADRINRSIERAAAGLTDPVAKVTQIATETEITLYNGITTDEIDQATINAAVQNIQNDIEYDKVATRLLLKTIYRKVIGDYNKDSYEDLKARHKAHFSLYIHDGVKSGKLDQRMIDVFNLDELADALDPSRDDQFTYAGLSGWQNRYSLKNTQTQDSLETPQYFFMRVAMGLSFNEKEPNVWAKKFYDKMSAFDYIAGGSTNLGAGTVRASLSNCILMQMEDDMQHIAKCVSDVLNLSKDSAGIGLSLTKMRATGSPLFSNSGVSSGPTPFAKIIDTAIRAVVRGGKKKGACCFYMENWHVDFPEFIDWKHNAGDDYLRMRTANTAAYLSDEFMKRVQEKKIWYMFDPKETPDLVELYGADFSRRYAEYIEMAEAGQMRMFKKVPAEEQYRAILASLQSTSHPWITWKDSFNVRALNNNTGTIHMSNLCTEIALPQDRENIAVCNLASINLVAHINRKEIDWHKLDKTVRLAVRHLDNLIDINNLSIAEARKSDRENRAVGLGVMGFSDLLEQFGLAYDTTFAYDMADRIFEFISYIAIDESANLAQERGSYQNFPGSRWSKGMVPVDTLAVLEEERGRAIQVSKSSLNPGLNWNNLRAKVRQGMRNATLMAVAPNANIGLLVGTTPGFDPRFAQVFSRNKISGKYMDLNHNLVKDLKNMGLWNSVKDVIIEHMGDISNIPGIPQHIKDVYKTAFTTSPYGFIEVAARAQKWVDQALSRNMYLETRDIDEIMKIYMTAWEKGLKSTYYLHMKPRHTAEQSTTKVNKSDKMGKTAFGAFTAMRKAVVAEQEENATDTLDNNTELPPNPVDDIPAPDTISIPEVAPAPQPYTQPIPSPFAPPVVHAPTASAPTSGPFAKAQAPQPLAFVNPNPIETPIQSMPTPAPAPTPITNPLAASAAMNVGPTPAPKVFVSKNPPKVCPTDPMELLQCDSCQ